MINTLPNYPQVFDGGIWSASHSGLPLRNHESPPSLMELRGHRESSIMGETIMNNEPIDSTSFWALQTGNPHLLNDRQKHHALYGGFQSAVTTGAPFRSTGSFQSVLPIGLNVTNQSSLTQSQQPLRRQHMMEDRVKNPCKVFIGGIGQGTVESTIRQHFSQYGNIVDCAIVKHRKSGKSRGFGFVTFSEEFEAQTAVRAKHKLDDVLVECREALPRDEARVAAPHDSLYMPTKIFVGGIPDTVQEDDFKLFFQKFGEVVDVSLAYDKSNHRPRGFGFVVFATAEAANQAVGCHSFHGKTVEAKHAVPRDVPKLPKNGRQFRRSPQVEDNNRIGTSWSPHHFMTNSTNALQLQSALPNIRGPVLTDVPPLLIGQTYARDVEQYKWMQTNGLSPLTTFDIMSPTPMSQITTIDSLAGLTAGNIVSQGGTAVLDRLLLGGRSDSTSSFPALTPQNPFGEVQSTQDDGTQNVAGDSNNVGLKDLTGQIFSGKASDWSQNFFFSANPTSPLQAMPLVPVSSPLLVPGQPCLGNFISLDSLCSPMPAPSTPQNAQEDSGQRSPSVTWVQMLPQKIASSENLVGAANGSSPMFAFVNGSVGTSAAPQFQLASQGSLTSLAAASYFLPPPPQPSTPGSSPTQRKNKQDEVIDGKEVEGALNVTKVVANRASGLASSAAGIMSPSAGGRVTSFECVQSYPNSSAVAQSSDPSMCAASATSNSQFQNATVPHFGQSFFIQGAPAVLSKNPVASPLASPLFGQQTQTYTSPAHTRLIASPVLATTTAPGSLLPIGVLHPPAHTPVASRSPQRSESPNAMSVQSNGQVTSSPFVADKSSYEFNLPPPPLSSQRLLLPTTSTTNGRQ